MGADWLLKVEQLRLMCYSGVEIVPGAQCPLEMMLDDASHAT